MSEQLMIVRQLPVIEERLQTAKASIEQRVQKAMSLACTVETVKSVKKVRAEMNKELEEFETERKQIKKQVLAPYEAFDAVYKECVAIPYKQADTALKEQIDAIESEIKDDKRREAERYFDEYVASLSGTVPVPLAEFALFERAGLKCNMSESPKRLKEQAKTYIDAVAAELCSIAAMEHAEEVLFEYRKGVSLAEAARIVNERQAQLHQMRLNTRQQEKAEPQQAEATVEYFSAPAPVREPDPLYEVSFTVRGTREELKSVKEFLEKRGIQYECE